jgi:membrane-associated phospholipid phosphatase
MPIVRPTPAAPRSVALRRLALTLLIGAAGVALPLRSARAEDVIHPWELLGSSLTSSFGWPSLMWHAAAVAVTPPLVFGVDAPVQEWFQRPSAARETFAQTTFIFGGVAPVLVPLGFYVGGLAAESSEFATAGAAALQAVAIQAVFVTTLKWLSDRAGPFPDGDANRKRAVSGIFRDSKDPNDFNFNPFDLHGGLRWPSGHTASNVALVSALVGFYPNEPWIAAIGYPIALAIGIGMIEGDYHWLSDVIAGALIGHVIGWSVGRNFRKHYDARRNHAASPSAGAEFAPSLGTPIAIHGWF